MGRVYSSFFPILIAPPDILSELNVMLSQYDASLLLIIAINLYSSFFSPNIIVVDLPAIYSPATSKLASYFVVMLATMILGEVAVGTAHPLLSCILFKMRTISIEIKIPRHILEIVSFILHSHSFFVPLQHVKDHSVYNNCPHFWMLLNYI